MRSVEAALSRRNALERGKRLTLAVMKAAGAVALAAASETFAEYVTLCVKGLVGGGVHTMPDG